MGQRGRPFFPLLLLLLFGLSLLQAFGASLEVAKYSPWMVTTLIDGSVYFCRNGDCRLSFKGSPLVQTPEMKSQDAKMVFIPDPSNGNLFAFEPLQPVKKLDMNAKELVSRCPFVAPQGRVFLGSKETAMFLINAETGELQKTFNSKRQVVGGIENSLENQGSIYLTRTDYVIHIRDGHDREEWNFTYSEYGLDGNKPVDVGDWQETYTQKILENPGWLSQFPSLPISFLGISQAGVPESIKNPYTQKGLPLSGFTLGTQGIPFPSVYVGQFEGNLFALPADFGAPPAIEAPTEQEPEGEGNLLNPFAAPVCIVGEKCLAGGFFRTDLSSDNVNRSLLGDLSGEFDPDKGSKDYGVNSSTLSSSSPKPSLPPNITTQSPGSQFSYENVFFTLTIIMVGVGLGSFVTVFTLRSLEKPTGTQESQPLSSSSSLSPAAETSPSTPPSPPSSEEVAGVPAPQGSSAQSLSSVPQEPEREREPENPSLVDPVKGSPKKGKGKTKKKTSEDPASKDEAQGKKKGEHDFDAPVEVSTENLLDGWTRVGNLQVSSEVLGYGSHGTVVYLGKFENREVAVKRMLNDYYEFAEREVELLQKSDYHSSIIRYFCKERMGHFLYIALEYCEASLDNLYEKEQKGSLPIVKGKSKEKYAELRKALDTKQLFREIVKGLQHLHELNIVHRDIKPQNVLISKQKRALISDFGLCKKLEDGRSSFTTSASGTIGWCAPETIGKSSSSLLQASKLTKAVDVFSLGCLLFYLLTDGKHPFGKELSRQENIVKNRYDLSALKDLVSQDLIRKMIAHKPENRISTAEVLTHPFFWEDSKRLNFLQDVSDKFENADKNDPFVLALEAQSAKIMGPSFCQKLDKLLLDNLGKFRKYQDNSVRDLMRLIRNKKHHYQDLPDEVKELVGPLPSGYFKYFTDRFPLLFLHVYNLAASTPACRESEMFTMYFG